MLSYSHARMGVMCGVSGSPIAYGQLALQPHQPSRDSSFAAPPSRNLRRRLLLAVVTSCRGPHSWTIFDHRSSLSLQVVDLCPPWSSQLVVSDDDASSRVVQHPPPLHSVSTRHTLCDRRRSLHLRCERYAEDRNELNPPCCKAAVVARTISRGQRA